MPSRTKPACARVLVVRSNKRSGNQSVEREAQVGKAHRDRALHRRVVDLHHALQRAVAAHEAAHDVPDVTARVLLLHRHVVQAAVGDHARQLVLFVVQAVIGGALAGGVAYAEQEHRRSAACAKYGRRSRSRFRKFQSLL